MSCTLHLAARTTKKLCKCVRRPHEYWLPNENKKSFMTPKYCGHDRNKSTTSHGSMYITLNYLALIEAAAFQILFAQLLLKFKWLYKTDSVWWPFAILFPKKSFLLPHRINKEINSCNFKLFDSRSHRHPSAG